LTLERLGSLKIFVRLVTLALWAEAVFHRQCKYFTEDEIRLAFNFVALLHSSYG